MVFGNIVLEFLPFFKLYFVYCNEFEEHRAFLERVKSTEEINEFKSCKGWFESIEHTPTLKNMDLLSILVMPVQRLPKYILLFKDLLKHTEETHPDFENLKKCLQKFTDLNEENNRKMDRNIKNMKLFELQTVFGII